MSALGGIAAPARSSNRSPNGTMIAPDVQCNFLLLIGLLPIPMQSRLLWRGMRQLGQAARRSLTLKLLRYRSAGRPPPLWETATMKTIGLVGGMSWESTATYYQVLNRLARQRLGGLHSARLIVWSFDFADIAPLQANDDWSTAAAVLCDAAQRLQRAGADCLVICTNTMHKLADAVAAAVNIPLIHIADATAQAIKQSGARRPLLLATRYTMEQDFYTGRLRDHHAIEVMVPAQADRDLVHDIIYRELCQGVVSRPSKQTYLDVVARSRDAGADSVIFGCTEIGLLLKAGDVDVPSFDTTELHAAAALSFALST